MKKVLIIFGGCSTEYEVSLQSVTSVLEAIDRTRYEVLIMGIDKDGRAYAYEGKEEKIAENTWQQENCYPATISMSRGCPMLWIEKDGGLQKQAFDIVFPVMHGKNGEDGTLQGLCELAGIPVAGCGMESAVLGMDKDIAHTLVSLAGIRVPESICLNAVSELAEKAAEIRKLGLPLFIKPVRAGSSFGISMVKAYAEMEEAVKEAFLHDKQVVIEEYIEGFEVGCAVMGKEELTVGRVDEITLAGGFFDYEEKYTLKTSEIHMPARISKADEKRVQNMAKVIYKTLGCKGFCRVDMFFTPQKEIVFNEVNTIPGFTSHSRFPRMMQGAGMDFKELVNKILELAE